MKKIDKDTWRGFLFFLLLLKELIQLLLNYLINPFVSRVIVYGLIIVCLFCLRKELLHSISGKDILFWLALGLILLFSFMLTVGEVRNYSRNVVRLCYRGITLFFVGKIMAKGDCDKYIKYIPWVGAIILFILMNFVSFQKVFSDTQAGDSSYSLSLAYYQVAPMIISIYYIFNGELKMLVCGVFLLFSMLSAGTRGAILCVAISTLFYIFIKMRKSSVQNWIGVGGGLIGAIIIYTNINWIVAWLMPHFIKLGLSTRLLYKFQKGQLASTSGRDMIYEKCIHEIMSHPFWGTGVFRDRSLMGSAYPHNIFIEWLLQYGLFPGLVIIGYFLFLVLNNSLFFVKEEQKIIMVLIPLMSIGFFSLITSFSYLETDGFWLLLGYLVALNNKCVRKKSMVGRDESFKKKVAHHQLV